MKMAQLADLADKIIEVGPVSTISSVQGAFPSAHASDISSLRQQIDNLSVQVQSLTTQLHRERGRSPKRRPYHQQRQRSRSNSQKHPFCWYHWKYGASARKCALPCSFQQTPPSSEENRQSASTHGLGNARTSRD